MIAPQLHSRGFTPAAVGDGEGVVQQALGELLRVDTPLVFVFDQQTRKYLYLDGPWERMFGVTREQMMADPDAWQGGLDVESRAAAATLRRDLELQGQVVRVLRVTLPDGQRRTLRATAVARQILGRSVVSGSVLELELPRRAQDEAGPLRLAVDNAQEGVAVTDASGCYVFLNREHAVMFGYEGAEELIGQSWRGLYSEAMVRQIEETVFPEVMAKGVWRGRLLAKRRDGSQFDEELTLSLLPDGGIVCNCRDVSGEVGLAARLAASEEMLRTFLHSLPVGVTIRSIGGSYEFVNRTTLNFLGVGFLARIEGSGLEVCLTSDPAFASWGALDQRVATTGEAETFDFPIHWAGKDWVLNVQKMALRIGADGTTHVCTLVNDVTEQRRLEAAAVASAQQRESYLLMQREFIAMVSHEFRTPLTSIRGVHYLLTQKAGRLPPELAADWRRLLGMQELAIGTLTELVDQVLLLNRIEHMSREIVPHLVPLAEFVGRVVGNIAGSLENGRVVLDLNVPKDFAAMVDEPQMRAVLENLISNGLKYAPETTKVNVAVKAEQDRWELTVADHGRGIPREDQAKLFQPFHRASNVRQVPGTGLGLTIIRRVVDYHRGSVSLTSEVDQGTTFTLVFPREFMAAGAATPMNSALPFSTLRPQ